MGHFAIAGGSRGIGLAVSKKLIALGHSVTVFSREAGEISSIESAKHIVHDFASADEIPTAHLTGPLDGMVYCPGSLDLAPVHRVKPESMRTAFEINCVSAIRFLQAALPGLKASTERTASVVLLSTVAVARGLAMHTSIAAAKGALEAVARTLAAELAPKVRVNCVAPALTETDLAARFFTTDEKRAAMNAMYPLQRTGTPDDIAEAVTMLLLPGSDWITGQTLGVDGGMARVQK